MEQIYHAKIMSKNSTYSIRYIFSIRFHKTHMLVLYKPHEMKEKD